MEAVEAGEDWDLTARNGGERDEDAARARADEPDRRRRLALRRPRRPVRHDHQPLAHLPGVGPDQRLQPLQRVHARRRLGLQPGLAQPDEIPPRGRQLRRRGLRARGRRRLPRPGDRRRLLQLPDRGDRRQRQRLPPARARLRQPRRAADVGRAPLRLRRGPQRRRRDHGADDRPRLPPVGADRRRGDRPLRRVREEPRGAQRGDADAPRRLLRRRPDRDQGRAARGGAAVLGRGGRARRGARLPQRAGDGAGADRDDQLPDGLRHDRDRARLLAGQVQGAGRRRADDDRQPVGAAGAAHARLRRAAGRADQRPHRRAEHDRRRARASRTSTCRSSTSRSASGRSPTPATST